MVFTSVTGEITLSQCLPLRVRCEDIWLCRAAATRTVHFSMWTVLDGCGLVYVCDKDSHCVLLFSPSLPIDHRRRKQGGEGGGHPLDFWVN